jgi:hypothetical protein
MFSTSTNSSLNNKFFEKNIVKINFTNCNTFASIFLDHGLVNFGHSLIFTISIGSFRQLHKNLP